MLQLGYAEIVMRLGAAVLAGAVIGFDREVKDKPAGMRTMALVSLGSAVFALFAAGASADPMARIVQGVVTGVGFLGAGAIITRERTVRGLTTAASTWLSAAVGLACGFAYWPLAVVATAFGVFVLVLGPVEDWLKRRL